MAHNVAQLLMAVFTRSWGIVYIALLLFSLLTGYFVGVLSRFILRSAPLSRRCILVGTKRQDLTRECRICHGAPYAVED